MVLGCLVSVVVVGSWLSGVGGCSWFPDVGFGGCDWLLGVGCRLYGGLLPVSAVAVATAFRVLK